MIISNNNRDRYATHLQFQQTTLNATIQKNCIGKPNSRLRSRPRSVQTLEQMHNTATNELLNWLCPETWSMWSVATEMMISLKLILRDAGYVFVRFASEMPVLNTKRHRSRGHSPDVTEVKSASTQGDLVAENREVCPSTVQQRSSAWSPWSR